MIQRIQTIYYGIALLLLIWITAGATVVSFQLYTADKSENIDMHITSFGVAAEAQLDLTDEELTQFERHITATGARFVREGNQMAWTNMIPVFIIFGVIALLVVAAILQYKKQKVQLRFGRIAFLLTLVMTAALFILITLIPGHLEETALRFFEEEQITASRSLGIGFYLLCAVIPFLFLGNMGVRRDLKLLQSLDRLR
jgi:amino acid transporter